MGDECLKDGRFVHSKSDELQPGRSKSVVRTWIYRSYGGWCAPPVSPLGMAEARIRKTETEIVSITCGFTITWAAQVRGNAAVKIEPIGIIHIHMRLKTNVQSNYLRGSHNRSRGGVCGVRGRIEGHRRFFSYICFIISIGQVKLN